MSYTCALVFLQRCSRRIFIGKTVCLCTNSLKGACVCCVVFCSVSQTTPVLAIVSCCRAFADGSFRVLLHGLCWTLSSCNFHDVLGTRGCTFRDVHAKRMYTNFLRGAHVCCVVFLLSVATPVVTVIFCYNPLTNRGFGFKIRPGR